MQTSVGSFAISTGVAGTTQDITDPGFTPDFVRFFFDGRTEAINTTGVATHQRGMGVAINSNLFSVVYPNFCTYTKSQDGVPPNTASDQHELRCIATILAASNTVDGEASVTTWLSNGFRLTIDNQFSAGTRIFYKAYKGVTNIQTLLVTEPAVAGNQTWAFNFTPDYLYCAPNPNGALTVGISDDSRMSMGAATFRNNGVQQFTCGMGANDNVATANTLHYNIFGNFISHLDTNFGTALTGQLTILSRNGNNVFTTWNIVSGGGNREHIILAIKGGEWEVGFFETVAAGNPIAVTSGFQPKGGTFYSVNRPVSASGVCGDIDEWTVGVFDQNSIVRSMTVEDDDGATPNSLVSTVLQYDSIYVGSDGIGGVDARITLTSINAAPPGVTLQQVLSDLAGRRVYYEFEGDNAPDHVRRDDWTRIRM